MTTPTSSPVRRTDLLITGMTCQGCARHVGEALESVERVDRAAVNLEEARAVVTWREGAIEDADALIRAVQRAGYGASLPVADTPPDPPGRWHPVSGWFWNVVIGAGVTIPLMVLEWGFGAGHQRWYHWLAFLLVAPVQMIGGARFYRGAWRQLRAGRSNMDTLVALGSTSAFAFSAWGLFTGWTGHLFFMESAAIITLISTGHWIECKVSARADRSLRALLTLAPATARRLNAEGLESEVSVNELRIGDRLVLRPGDRVPVDGCVLEGESAVDESILTGESSPVEKSAGATVFGGTMNLNGRLVLRVAATGGQTALAQIIAAVQRAQQSRAGLQKLGDRVSSVFVPVVVVLALATGLWWGLAPDAALAASRWLEPFLWSAHHPAGAWAAAIYHAAAVLIVACPCAMGLATPIAILAGTNVGSERGILIRDGAALEKSGRVTTVLFDKTGTLTEGRPAVVARHPLVAPAFPSPAWENLAASLARPSRHPLSLAVAGLASGDVSLTGWREVRGCGLEAFLGTSDAPRTSPLSIPFDLRNAPAPAGRMPVAIMKPFPAGVVSAGLASLPPRDPQCQAVARLGSLRWLRECGVPTEEAAAFADTWIDQAATVLGVALDSRLLGVVALRDALKPSAARVVEAVRSTGKEVGLVTGDDVRTGQAIGRQAGFLAGEIVAGVKPEDKAGIVRELQQRGRRVAFVGDGINDAPALEQADLGIAMSRASDVAREAADIILLKADLQAVPEALALARATLRTIKQNLFWAFFYNVAGIPLAMLGLLSPVVCALAMGLSDLIVIGNALRLRRGTGWKS